MLNGAYSLCRKHGSPVTQLGRRTAALADDSGRPASYSRRRPAASQRGAPMPSPADALSDARCASIAQFPLFSRVGAYLAFTMRRLNPSRRRSPRLAAQTSGLPVDRKEGVPDHAWCGLLVYRSTRRPLYRSTGRRAFRTARGAAFSSAGRPRNRYPRHPATRTSGNPVTDRQANAMSSPIAWGRGDASCALSLSKI
jgi:hypothetical protein